MSYRDSVKRSLEECLKKSRKFLEETREELEQDNGGELNADCEEQLKVWEEILDKEEKRISEIFK